MADKHSPPPIKHLRSVVAGLQGPAAQWHRQDLASHEPRYLADFALVQELAPQGQILEIGAAPCHTTGLLSLAGWPVVGVDLQPPRVQEIVDALHLDLRRSDIERERLPFADGSFSFVMLCETFEHLRVDPAFVISEIHRVLAPGGRLLLSTPNLYALPNLARFLVGRSIADPHEEFGKLRSMGHMGHVREYSAREVSRFLTESGFAIEWLRYRSHRHAGWKQALLSLGYLLAPRRFGRELVLLAVKDGEGPGLSPLP